MPLSSPASCSQKRKCSSKISSPSKRIKTVTPAYPHHVPIPMTFPSKKRQCTGSSVPDFQQTKLVSCSRIFRVEDLPHNRRCQFIFLDSFYIRRGRKRPCEEFHPHVLGSDGACAKKLLMSINRHRWELLLMTMALRFHSMEQSCFTMKRPRDTSHDLGFGKACAKKLRTSG